VYPTWGWVDRVTGWVAGWSTEPLNSASNHPANLMGWDEFAYACARAVGLDDRK